MNIFKGNVPETVLKEFERLAAKEEFDFSYEPYEDKIYQNEDGDIYMLNIGVGAVGNLPMLFLGQIDGVIYIVKAFREGKVVRVFAVFRGGRWGKIDASDDHYRAVKGRIRDFIMAYLEGEYLLKALGPYEVKGI